MEKKNKKTTTKKTKDEYKKGKAGVAARTAAAKRTAAKKTTKKEVEEKEVKKSTVKKETTKEEKVTKKAPEKKVTPKKVEKVVEKEETEDIDFLEKTIIFDGKDRDNLRNVVDKLEEETIVTKNRIVRRKPINKIIIYVLIALIAITVVGTSVYVIKDLVQEKTNKETVNSNIYRKVSKNYKDQEIQVKTNEEEEQYAHFHTVTLTEFEKKILDKEDMTVLISSQNCMGCLLFEPELEKALDEHKKTIYRLDITNWDEDEKLRFRTYYHFTATPTIFVVEEGIVTKDSTNIPEDVQKLVEWTLENVK